LIRRAAVFVGVVYVVAVLFIVLWPSASYAKSSVSRITEVVHALGGPSWITTGMVEFATNIALFVPLSFLGAIILDRWGLTFWFATGFLATAGIELFQLVVLSARSASVVDMVANTLGAVIGAVLVRLCAPTPVSPAPRRWRR
jgi:glycopeptide antibiotics resistance protein